MWVVTDLLWIEGIETADPSEEQLTARGTEVGTEVEVHSLQTMTEVVVLETLGLWTELGDPLVGTHPDVALLVDEESVDVIVRQPVFVGVALEDSVTSKAVLTSVAVETAPSRADP